MGFANFGTVSFTDEAKVADFITFLEQDKVMATKCKNCGTKCFPPRVDCPSCPDSEIEWFQIDGIGKLLTYTQVNYGPSGFEDDSPYILAIVNFADGLRVFGRLAKEIDFSEIAVGMDLKIAPARLTGDRLSYEFYMP